MLKTWPQELIDALNTEIKVISSLTPEAQKEHFASIENFCPPSLTASHPIVLAAHPWNGERISTHGDLVIGFAALDGDVRGFEVTIGPHRHESLRVDAMPRGTWTAALGSRFPLPLLNMYEHPVRLHADTAIENCWIVYAILDSREMMHRIGTGAWLADLGDVSWIFANGMGHPVKDKACFPSDKMELFLLPEIKVKT